MKKLLLILTLITLTPAQDYFHSVAGGTPYTILKQNDGPNTHYIITEQGIPIPVQAIPQQQYPQQNPQLNTQLQIQQLLLLQQQQLMQNQQQISALQSKVTTLGRPKVKTGRKKPLLKKVTSQGTVNNALLGTAIANETLNKDSKYVDKKKARIGVGAGLLLNNLLR